MTKNENYYKFQFQNNEGKYIDCELIISFYIKKYNKHFLLFTDYSKNKDGYLNVYPYYEEKNTNTLIPVTNNQELKTVYTIYETAKKEIKEQE